MRRGSRRRLPMARCGALAQADAGRSPPAVLPLVEGAVGGALLRDGPPPGLVAHVPVDGRGEAVVEGGLRFPAQRAQLRGVERVAAVVARAVRDRGDERRRPVEGAQDAVRQVEVGGRVPAADVVGVAAAAALDQQVDGAAVIVDVQPVAHVEAVAVERQRPLPDGVGDEERDELLRVLARPVVVRRPRDDHRHAVGRPVAVGQPVGCRLGGRVRVAGPQLVRLPARTLGDAAVDLVGRDLHETTEVGRLARCVEQHERAEDVGPDEGAGALQRAVDVRLGREVDDDLRPPHQRPGDGGVGDVAMHEAVARVVVEVGQVLAPPRVGQRVEGGDAPVRVRVERVVDEVAPDEAGAPRDDDLNHPCAPSRRGACRAAPRGARPDRRSGRARTAR